jgi:hypothetical protein
MPETKFEGVMRAPQAVVAKVGGGWAVEGAHAVASDPVLHLPLHDPRIPQPAPQPPPAPPPTEAEHRAALADALERQRQADEAVTQASAAHERAMALVAQRRTELAAFASLDDDRFARTLDSLRDDNGFGTTPNEDERLAKREIAKVKLDEAERAEATLMAERAVMAQAAGNAAREVNRLAVSVLCCVADGIADEHAALLREAAVRKSLLFSFDQFAANSGARLSGKVATLVLSDGQAALARLRDTSQWRAAKQRLLEDPMAEISISIQPAASQPRAVDYTVTPPGGLREEDRVALAFELEQQRKSALA